MLTLISWGVLNAQQIPGAAQGVTSPAQQNAGFLIPARTLSPERTNDYIYTTTVYTFYDLVIFSYFDGSDFKLFDTFGTAIDSVTLNKDQFHVFSPGTGIFRIDGNTSYTLLTGDPITNNVMGFFAVDQSGRALSTHLNTYMPLFEWGGERFIVFAYNDGTEFYIKDLTSGYTVASGILNAGEHYESLSLSDAFLGVRASKPVSALSYADQGYYIPSTNGTFAGTEFYGFSSDLGEDDGWPNGVVITAYHDATDYLVVNTTTGDTLFQGMLNAGEATRDYVEDPTYYKVTTSKNVTLFNTPYAYYDNQYYYLAVLIDEQGYGAGTNIYAPVIEGDLNLLSHEDNNLITVVDMSDLSLVWQDTLAAGEGAYLYSTKTVYHISGTGNLSAINSYGGSFGACFVPLNFSSDLADLSISTEDISFVPDVENRNPDDAITIQATVHNYGFQGASNVGVYFYDGDPSGGYRISAYETVEAIPAGAAHTFTLNWTVPENPLYHAVYVSADPYDYVLESNGSNNLAYKFIIPNNDFLPPLSTYIEAPSTVMAIDNIPEFNNFMVNVSIYNSGSVDAPNVYAKIILPPGLVIYDQVDSVGLGTYTAEETAGFSWLVSIDNLPDGDAIYYAVKVGADNAPEKILERRLLINRGLAIADPVEVQVPRGMYLKTNYPNPFNPTTTIEYAVDKTADVLIDVHDINGRKITTLVHGIKSAGIYRLIFNGSSLVSGVYFVSMNSGNFHDVHKMMLIK
jgi:hypothetical protein